MAVIAVGDFDPAAIEKEIQARFGDLQEPGKQRPRAALPRAARARARAVTIETDPRDAVHVGRGVRQDGSDRAEATQARLPAVPRRELYHDDAQRALRGARARSRRAVPLAGLDAPVSCARVDDVHAQPRSVKEGSVEETLRVLFTEIARVERHGFTRAELERARKDRLSCAENSRGRGDKTPTRRDSPSEITRNFFEHEQMPGATPSSRSTASSCRRSRSTSSTTSPRTWGGDQGRVIAISGPAKAKLPTEAEIAAHIDEGSNTSSK